MLARSLRFGNRSRLKLLERIKQGYWRRCQVNFFIKRENPFLNYDSFRYLIKRFSKFKLFE